MKFIVDEIAVARIWKLTLTMAVLWVQHEMLEYRIRTLIPRSHSRVSVTIPSAGGWSEKMHERKIKSLENNVKNWRHSYADSVKVLRVLLFCELYLLYLRVCSILYPLMRNLIYSNSLKSHLRARRPNQNPTQRCPLAPRIRCCHHSYPQHQRYLH